MARQRLNGVITGRTSIEASMVDAMGGGLCDIHGKFFGYGVHGLRACRKCDIEEHHKQKTETRKAYCISCGKKQYAKVKGTGTIDNLCKFCGNHMLNLYLNKDIPFVEDKMENRERHKETSYGSTSDDEDKIIIGSGSYKRQNAKYNRSVQNELDRVLNRSKNAI